MFIIKARLFYKIILTVISLIYLQKSEREKIN